MKSYKRTKWDNQPSFHGFFKYDDYVHCNCHSAGWHTYMGCTLLQSFGQHEVGSWINRIDYSPSTGELCFVVETEHFLIETDLNPAPPGMLKPDLFAEKVMNLVRPIVEAVKLLRVEHNAKHCLRMHVILRSDDEFERAVLLEERLLMKIMTKATSVTVTQKNVFCEEMAHRVIGNVDVYVSFVGATVAASKDHERLTKDLAKVLKELAAVVEKLSLPAFMTKAPEAIITSTKEAFDTLTQQKTQLEVAIEKLRT